MIDRLIDVNAESLEYPVKRFGQAPSPLENCTQEAPHASPEAVHNLYSAALTGVGLR